jgi:K(+)-stimulated pyrophosphate-energized sodium pump
MNAKMNSKSFLGVLVAFATMLVAPMAWATQVATDAVHEHAGAMAGGVPVHHGGEADLIVPKLSDPALATFFGMPGSSLLAMGLGVCALGMVFGLVIFLNLRNAPVHKSMLEVSELIYETCKTYLITQMKFIAILELFIGSIIVVYFGVFQKYFEQGKTGQVIIILLFSLVGIAGSSAVAWFGIRVNTFAN